MKSKDRRHSESKAWRWYSKMIRLEAADNNGIVQCFTCTTRKHWKQIDVGHYYPQGVNKSLKFDPKNTHPQCISCNKFKHGNLYTYAERLVETYGSNIFDYFKIARTTRDKITQDGFEVMTKDFRNKARAIAAEKGIELIEKEEE